MVNIGSHLALNQAKLIRFFYSKFLFWIVKKNLCQTKTISAKVYAFSCERDLPEQVVSIRSFIKHVGVPSQFTVISDGTYSEKSKRLLQQIDASVVVLNWRDLVSDRLPIYLDRYASIHPFGKKLSVLVNLPIDETVIYADSDILFFPSAKEIIDISQNENKNNYYLPDCESSLDDRLLKHDNERSCPINAGFIIFQKENDWKSALERLAELKGEPNFFTEQTVVHLAMHKNGAVALSQSKYVISRADTFMYKDLFAENNIAIRHYINTVRHKFWLSSMKSSILTKNI
jgi:hypothetical protein